MESVTRVLVAGVHHPVGSMRFMVGAFQRVGVDVRHVGQASPGVLRGFGPVDDRYTWEPMGPFDVRWEDWTPDLVLYMSQDWPVWRSSYPDVPHAPYITCNNVCNLRPELQKQEVPEGFKYEHYFLASGMSEKIVGQMSQPVRHADETYLPNAYDPTLHVASPIPWAEREYDVCMVGRISPDRKRVLDALADAGLKVYAAEGVIGHEYVAAYHHSRIGLVHSPHSTVGFRTFETPRMGCLPLSNLCTDHDILKPEGFLIYNSPQDAVDLARYALAQPIWAVQTARKAYQWAEPHTWDARARTIVEWIRDRR